MRDIDIQIYTNVKQKEISSIDLSGVWDTVNIPDIQVRLHSFISQFKPKPNCTELETHLKKSRQQNYPYHHPKDTTFLRITYHILLLYVVNTLL
jgi:hypothetical protein